MIALLVRKRLAVYTFAALIIVAGLWAYMVLPRESVPQIEQPYIFVTTTYAGVSAQEIEQLVTRPLEEEIEGVDNIDQIMSTSRQSFSFIMVEFTSDVSVEDALRRVQDKVDAARGELPPEADEPVVTELSASDWPILVVVLSNPRALKLLNEDVERIRDELEAVPGVLEVEVAGDLEREVAVELDPDRLAHYGLSIDDVVDAVRTEHVDIPGGFLETPLRKYNISVSGRIEVGSAFGDIMVSRDNVSVPISSVGIARFTTEEPQTYSRINSVPAISFSVSQSSGENIIRIVDQVKQRIQRLLPTLPPGTKVTYVQDQSERVRDMVADLENNILTGLVLVLVVTLFFLGPVNAFFVSLAIPFTMLLSFAVLQLLGITLNMVVLFSLVMALGMLVDNAIVIVENIYRHASQGTSRTRAAIEGTAEVALPITASTVTTLLAFLPILFMPDVIGDFMSFMPKTIIIVLSASLVTAIVILPVLCARFLRLSEHDRKQIEEGGTLFVRFQKWYAAQIERAVVHPYITVAAIGLLGLLGFVAYGVLGKDVVFFTEVDPSDAIVRVETPPGIPLDETDTLVRRVETIVRRVPASLQNYQATSGRSGERFAGGTENNRGIVRLAFVSFNRRKVRARTTIDSLRDRVDTIAGARVVVEPNPVGPPTGNDVSYRIGGQSYDSIGVIAAMVRAILESYPQFRLVDSDFERAEPEIRVDIDRREAAFYNVSTNTIASTIRGALTGIRAGTFRTFDDEHDIEVRYAKRWRRSLRAVRELDIVNRRGRRLPLSALAAISRRSAVGVIKRRDLQRAVEVWADFREETASRERVKQEIAQRLADLETPDGYRVEEGESEMMRGEATRFLQQAFVVALFLIAIVLVGLLDSYMQPFIIMVSVALSIGGVLGGYVLTLQPFVVVMSGVGCIALAGVVVNNGIVLIDYLHIVVERGTEWRSAIVEAAATRLRPVLLTAITTILGILPMAMGISIDFRRLSLQIGSESSALWRPFAWAMIFGLGFATLTTLVVVPALLAVNYHIVGKRGNGVSE